VGGGGRIHEVVVEVREVWVEAVGVAVGEGGQGGGNGSWGLDWRQEVFVGVGEGEEEGIVKGSLVVIG